ncbi:MAG: hypothetical protein WAV23_03955 [Minisyncoccia bacterium]
MTKQNIRKYIPIIAFILIIIGGYYLSKSKKVEVKEVSPVIINEIKDQALIPEPAKVLATEVTNPPEVKDTKPVVNTPVSTLTKEQQTLLTQLKKSADARDFESFAVSLDEVYKNKYSEIRDFIKVESDLYVYAYDTYFQKGDLATSLKVSSTVFYKVPEAWRFRYLRIVTLEKYGRNAFDIGYLTIAEEYANKILQMTFRLEGTNLLADVYISKINTNIKEGNTDLAKQNLGFIWDYEVGADRRTTLTELKAQLGL